MKRSFLLLPFLALVGCHATPTPRDESFVAFVTARTFSICTEQFMITTERDAMMCACLARTVSDNTRAAKLFDKKTFRAGGDKALPTETQLKACAAEVQ